MSMRKRAFTLVELLVVISIIALLLAILMPSLNKAREQAKKVLCMGNLRQVAFGFNFYTNDYGVYPSRDSTSTFYYDWTAELIHTSYPWFFYMKKSAPAFSYVKKDWSNKYIGDFDAMTCPSDKGDLVDPKLVGKNFYKRLGTSYFYNCRDNGESADDRQLGSLMYAKPANIRNSSTLIILGDPEMNAQWGGVNSELRYRWHEKKLNYANVIFADFHVQGIVMTPYPGKFQSGPGWTFVANPDPYGTGR